MIEVKWIEVFNDMLGWMDTLVSKKSLLRIWRTIDVTILLVHISYRKFDQSKIGRTLLFNFHDLEQWCVIFLEKTMGLNFGLIKKLIWVKSVGR